MCRSDGQRQSTHARGAARHSVGVAEARQGGERSERPLGEHERDVVRVGGRVRRSAQVERREPVGRHDVVVREPRGRARVIHQHDRPVAHELRASVRVHMYYMCTRVHKYSCGYEYM